MLPLLASVVGAVLAVSAKAAFLPTVRAFGGLWYVDRFMVSRSNEFSLSLLSDCYGHDNRTSQRCG